MGGLPWPYPGGVIMMGRSMGAIPAVHLAALHADKVEALVLDSPLACQYPFSSLSASKDPEVFDNLASSLGLKLQPPTWASERFSCTCCSSGPGWGRWRHVVSRASVLFDN